MTRFRIVVYILTGGLLITGWNLSSSFLDSPEQAGAAVAQRPMPDATRRYRPRHSPRPHAPPSEPEWRKATAQERQQAIAIIAAQLRAFRKGDYELATQYQNRQMRLRVGAPINLRQIIENGYPQFANAKQVYYGRALVSGSDKRIRVTVQLVTPENEVCRAHYVLAREGNDYRIEAVIGGGVINRVPDEPAPVLIDSPQKPE